MHAGVWRKQIVLLLIAFAICERLVWMGQCRIGIYSHTANMGRAQYNRLSPLLCLFLMFDNFSQLFPIIPLLHS